MAELLFPINNILMFYILLRKSSLGLGPFSKMCYYHENIIVTEEMFSIGKMRALVIQE